MKLSTRRKEGENAPDTTLCDVKPGKVVRIEQLDEHVDPTVRRRLAALGFRPGEDVTCIRRAPMGCPILFRVCGAEVCLRKEQARTVSVGACAPSPVATTP